MFEDQEVSFPCIAVLKALKKGVGAFRIFFKGSLGLASTAALKMLLAKVYFNTQFITALRVQLLNGRCIFVVSACIPEHEHLLPSFCEPFVISEPSLPPCMPLSFLDPPLPGAGPVDGIVSVIDGRGVDDLLDVAVPRCRRPHLHALSRLPR